MMTRKFSSEELQIIKSPMKILKLSKSPTVMKNTNPKYWKRKKYLWTQFHTILSLSQSIKLTLDLWKSKLKRNFPSKKEFITFLTHQTINRKMKNNNKAKKYPHRQKKVAKALQGQTHQMTFKDWKTLKCNDGMKL